MPSLAAPIVLSSPKLVYALPYYTRAGVDTEYLVSNPNPAPISGTLAVVGRDCRVVKQIRFRLAPSCTQSFRLRPIVPDHAGHSLLVSDGPVIPHLLYYQDAQLLLVGGELANRGNVLAGKDAERSRTYGFGYRAAGLGSTPVAGSLFTSNPLATPLSGTLVFYDQRCREAARARFRMKPGCTREFPFPAGRFGYGLIQVSQQAVLNVLHTAPSPRRLAAALLLGEGDRVDAPVEPPQRRRRVLFDDTHACRPGAVGDWTQYEAALAAAGCIVAHHGAAPVTLAALQQHDAFVVASPRAPYTAAEKQAMVDFVSAGGGVLVVQDFGNAPWSVPTREILNLFGTSDDNNFAQDPTNCFTPGQFDDVVFDEARNFHPHPIVTGVTSFHVDAAASLSSGPGWTTVAETDDDSTPARRPMLGARSLGSGRVVAFGDSNTWADHLIGNLDNRRLGVRCVEWLLFRI
jgi:hypothetical protein